MLVLRLLTKASVLFPAGESLLLMAVVAVESDDCLCDVGEFSKDEAELDIDNGSMENVLLSSVITELVTECRRNIELEATGFSCGFCDEIESCIGWPSINISSFAEEHNRMNCGC